MATTAALAIAAGAGGAQAQTITYAPGETRTAPIVLSTDTTELDVPSGSATQSGDISETGGSRPLTKTGGGSLTLSGTNTFTGEFSLLDGDVVLAGGAALADSVRVTLGPIPPGVSPPLVNLFVQDSETIGSLRGTGVVSIGDGQTLTVGANNQFSPFNGSIQGAGGLTKIGTGTLALSAPQTFAGPLVIEGGAVTVTPASVDGTLPDAVDVIINGGRLVIGQDVLQSGLRGDTIGSLSGAPGGELTIATHLTVGGNDASTTFAGTINTSGFRPKQFIKTGAGVLTLTGDSTYSHETIVEAGGLVVNGVLPSSISVAAGAYLGGDGQVGDVTVSGVVAPGNSVGALNVGNITLASGSTYEAEIAGDGTSDLIAATGTATIDGANLQVVALDPHTSYFTPRTYTVLTAAGGVSGAFGALQNDASLLRMSVEYLANSVRLTVQANVLDVPDLTPNQAQAGANQLQQSGDALAVFNTLLTLSPDQARGAFDSLSGEAHASFQHAAAQASEIFQSTVMRRAGALSGAGMAVQQAGGAQFWGAALAEGGEVDADGNAAELEQHFAGAAFGIEGGAAALGGTLTGGAAAGFLDGRGSVDARASTADIGAWRAGVYGAWDSGGGARVSGALSYGGADLDSTRYIAWPGLTRTAEADRDVDSIAATLEAAWRFPAGATGFSFAPVATLDYLHASADAVSETGAGAAGLTLAEADYDRLEAGLGLEVSHMLGAGLILDARAVALRRLDGEIPRQAVTLAGAPGAAFTATGPDAGRDRVALGVGLQGEITPRLSIGARYDGVLSSDFEAHQASVNLGWTL